ncbi:hypothetical protein L6Q96_02915 [Candidatus Binatia bacterium]|nr:hypothetical protein [Candidatus Binatia bacterium]
MTLELLGEINAIEVIARGRSVRRRAFLRKRFGAGQWRKLKGVAMVRLSTGGVHRAEIHWYEAHGVGRVGMKVKRYLD